jgi:hypothetical protein
MKAFCPISVPKYKAALGCPLYINAVSLVREELISWLFREKKQHKKRTKPIYFNIKQRIILVLHFL